MNLSNILRESLCCESTYEQFRNLNDKGLIDDIFPQMKDMKIVGECKYHLVNAYEHSLNALKEFEDIIKNEDFFSSHLKEHIKIYLNTNVDTNLNILEILKLGVFLHDVGKPESKTVDSTGRVHFKGHEIIGEYIVRNKSQQLNLNLEARDLLSKYVRHHMILLVLYKTDNMSKENLDKIFDILQDDIIGTVILGYCDIISTRKLLNPQEDMNIIKTYMEYVLTNYIYKYKKLN